MQFYFYDLETTGFNPREGRIMQFAGQRTSLKLEPIGNPDNIHIKITPDILPDPGAVLVTGITPQKTLTDGITEAEFAKYFQDKIAKPNTIFVGYNNIRFDDEFLRHLFYRNFHDPYEWHWADGKSRWDLLDVTRLTRALRPQGIKWPFDSSGAPSNQLGLLTSINKLDHLNAHDALSDVQATIGLAKLIKTKQPKLFEFLLSMRDKQKVTALVAPGKPFVYASGKYPSEYEKTTVAVNVAEHPNRPGAIVYDLRHDPTLFANLSVMELAAAWKRRDPTEGVILPVKTLQYNRCPAVAPLGTLDNESQARLKLDVKHITENMKKLTKLKDFSNNLVKAQEILDERQAHMFGHSDDVDNQLYDKFFNPNDKRAMSLVRAAEPNELNDLADKFKDERLIALLPLYKARNFPLNLTSEERQVWDDFRTKKLLDGGEDSRLGKFFAQIEELSQQPKLSKNDKYLLEELKIYGESLMPA
jgi:exodeoxyribonuclease I